MKKAATAYGILNFAGDIAKKVISPVDPELLRRGVMQVLDIKTLSKDLVDGIFARAGKQKEVIIQALVNEVSKFLNRIDINAELKKAAKDLSIEINAVVNITEKGSGKHVARAAHRFKIPAGKKGGGGRKR